MLQTRSVHRCRINHPTYRLELSHDDVEKRIGQIVDGGL